MDDLNYLNRLNNTKIEYYITEIKYINKTKRVILGYHIEATLLGMFNKDKECINVHICEDIVKRRMVRRDVTVKGTYDYMTNAVFLKRRTSESSLAHEFGHFFGLKHPHHHYNRGKCRQEAVDRTRRFKGCLFRHGLICEKSGDRICDTPAEPNLKAYTSDSCVYTGEDIRDNWGDLYSPDTRNVMSYARNKSCRTQFTLTQIAVMLHTAKEYDVEAWDATKLGADQPQYFIDRYEPDNTQKMASEILLNTSQKHTFHRTYHGKKAGDRDEDVDWVKFEIKNFTSRQLIIETSKGDYLAPYTKLFLYDKDEKLVASDEKIDARGFSKILVNRPENGSYYLKIVKTKQTTKSEICDYILTIKEL